MAIVLPLRPTAAQPAGYWLSQPYHNGASYNPYAHHALDMIGHYNQPVYAAESGRVFAAGWNADNWAIGGGYSVIIDHYGEGGRVAKTSYAHMARHVVVKGQYVMRGQLIGYADSTGTSTGHHLHFATGEAQGAAYLYYSYVWLDPRRYMTAHSFANGYWPGGDLAYRSYHLGRNTFRVSEGVNFRTGTYVSSASIIRTTTARTQMAYLSSRTGTSAYGSTLWYQLYDPVSGRIGYSHSALGKWVQ